MIRRNGPRWKVAETEASYAGIGVVSSIKFLLEFQRPGDREIEVGRLLAASQGKLIRSYNDDLFSPDIEQRGYRHIGIRGSSYESKKRAGSSACALSVIFLFWRESKSAHVPLCTPCSASYVSYFFAAWPSFVGFSLPANFSKFLVHLISTNIPSICKHFRNYYN